MNIEVFAALRFQHARALDDGLAAFDDTALPEFFTRALWSVSGTHARCNTSFEVADDLDYSNAFRMMAWKAVEGAVYLRVRGNTANHTAIVRLKTRSWARLPDMDASWHPWGKEVDEAEGRWAATLKDASRTGAAKVAKKKAASKSKRA